MKAETFWGPPDNTVAAAVDLTGTVRRARALAVEDTSAVALHGEAAANRRETAPPAASHG
ncbi:MAG TPA: hypothetical protein VF142_23675 [Longimicrobium sp.]